MWKQLEEIKMSAPRDFKDRTPKGYYNAMKAIMQQKDRYHDVKRRQTDPVSVQQIVPFYGDDAAEGDEDDVVLQKSQLSPLKLGQFVAFKIHSRRRESARVQRLSGTSLSGASSTNTLLGRRLGLGSPPCRIPTVNARFRLSPADAGAPPRERASTSS